MKFNLFKGNGVFAGYEETIKSAQERCDQQKNWYYTWSEELDEKEKIIHVTWLMINEQLKPFGLTYSDVKKGAKHEFEKIGFVEKKKLFGLIPYTKHFHKKVLWFQYYTFKTKEQFENWKQYSINLLKSTLDLTEKQAEEKFMWFNLCFGLKQDYA